MTKLLERLVAKDVTLWPEGNVAARRLGWIDAPRRAVDDVLPETLAEWAANVERAVLVGMGGSALGPEVLRAAVGSDRLVVLDTTDPATVSNTDLSDATVIVSSKSGTTPEVEALLAHCWDRVRDPARFVVITDRGSPLDRLARERAFHRIFTNDPDIGGRYSVLSLFGFVPAALLGYDIAELCDAALSADREAAVELGVAMAEAARAGSDKLTVVAPERFCAFGLWVEQLVAESTGKRGTGIVPVPTTQLETGADRHVVGVELSDPVELGREFYRWEIATAIAGHVLGIDPFDEPNVAESKQNTAKAIANLPLPRVPADTPGDTCAWLERTVAAGDYVSVQAYLPYGHDEELEGLRRRLRDRLDGAAVTAGYGPRFLHSTGQLHKGGPASVVALQIVARSPSAELAVPGTGYDFATLIAAQALGDLEALRAHGRRVRRIEVNDLIEVA